ncbi:MAG: 2-hydroxyacyl-CoA dehydratase [Planctomycetes bacterium]|nr:2-hydroxyacyl-CoA dehydratase [Planctomycetota bacterium]
MALYQDLGRNLQKDLLAKWYGDLALANERKEPVAYLFVSGNVEELLQAYGFHLVYPEINALQCGIKKAAGGFIQKAEEAGYSSDVCGYVKNDVGIALAGGKWPLGNLPKPDLLVCTYAGCTTYMKWFEALAQHFECPLFVLDVPFVRDEDVPAADIAYVVTQLRELSVLCQAVTGRTLSEERLRELVRLSAEAEDLWVRVLEMAKRRPSPLDGFFEAVFFMAPINVLRGTPECVAYYEGVLREMEERVSLGIGPIPEEKFRVVLEGPPPWPHFRAFWDLFKRWGVTCVASTYPRVGGIWDWGMRHDPERPWESIATHAMNGYTNWNLARRQAMMRRFVAEYHADALVLHSVKSCRAFSMGMADTRELFLREDRLPALFIESDLADPRYFSEAQLRTRVDAFFEALEHRRSARV